MKEGTIKNILDAVRDWVNTKEQAYKPGEIYETVPDEIIKMLWDGDVKFDELVPVSGANGLYPVDSITNHLHFLEIFYGRQETITMLKRNALTFTNTGNNDVSFKFISEISSDLPKLYLVDDQEVLVKFKINETYTIPVGSSIKIVGDNPKGNIGMNCTREFTDWSGDTTLKVSGKLTSLLDILGTVDVIPSTTDFSNLFHLAPITDASELVFPKNVVPSCYEQMFMGCEKLEATPTLPATILADGCYRSMFSGCTSITSAPELPATTLADDCYAGMFNGCRNLSHVKCLAIDITPLNCTTDWLSDVAEEGTFEMNPTVLWSRGGSGIPEGWNIVFDEEKAPYIMVKSNDTTGDVELYCYSMGSNQEVEYSTDRVLWNQLSSNDKIKIYRDAPLYLRGILTGPNCLDEGDYTNLQIHAVSGDYTHTAELYGNVNSIWDYRDLNAPLKEECGIILFSESDAITKAPVLPSRTLSGGCYAFMFNGCSSLTEAPELPATVLSDPSSMGYGCYENMFSNCSSLTTAPELPATALTDWCYTGMFRGCTSLTTAPVLPATTLARSCYYCMFQYCTSLTTAPELPATTLTQSCYEGMLSDCTSLTTAPELPATALTDWCYTGMFDGCTNLNYIKCLATDISATSCTNDWLIGVASTGTFVKDISATWPTGKNGIPSGWTVINNQKKK